MAGTVGRVVSRTGASWQVRRGKAELGRAGRARLSWVWWGMSRQVRRGEARVGQESHGRLGEAELVVVWQGRLG
jgi:hypothetical protein